MLLQPNLPTMKKEKSLELERLVFFSDAVVAIAITLLALELKLDHVSENLCIQDVWSAWPHFLAFFISFVIIGLFWKIHHQFFVYIRKINEMFLAFNMAWLFFIALLPFTTNLLSEHFDNKTAVVLYCANVLMISFFQNSLWDYACDQMILFPGKKVKNPQTLLDESTTKETITLYRLACNIHMVNAFVALIIAFFWPIVAIIVLFSRIFFFRTAAIKWTESRLERADLLHRRADKRKKAFKKK